MIANGSKVWVSILANGVGQPPVFSPGIVIDARVADRDVQQSTRGNTRSNLRLLKDTMVVVSYRVTPNKSFYTERAERVIGLNPRTEHLPVVDGAKGEDVMSVTIPNLRAQAARDLDKLIAPVTDQQTKAAAAQFAKMPALGRVEA